MRCPTRPRAYRWPLCWLVGLAVGALATATATAIEAPDPGLLETAQPAGGTADELEGAVTDEASTSSTDDELGLEEDLLGEAFDEEMEAIGLDEGLVSFALQGANVRDFCNWFAERLEINIIVEPDVDGPINASLTDVPWEVALRETLESHGFALTVSDDGIYRVSTGE